MKIISLKNPLQIGLCNKAKQDQYRMVGNSVPPDLSYALVLANFTHEQEYSLAS
ncbi:hypothetical protein NYW84_18965 [Acinetobacter junii]|uniref:hypothetical protein n=1 Tax=Acinetobacter junii TaxID=40215 RepID=UPI002DBC9840|nr:hypothetical protein [Acinetobacter junii]MEB8383038.1 hypothetical protein [Acinetobacter junii]